MSKITYPHNEQILSGIVTIQWDAAIDIWGHDIAYTVYYSYDAGNNWVQLVSDRPSTNYDWDTTILADHSDYMIRIVATCSEGLSNEDSSGIFTIENQPSITTTVTTTTTTTTTTITTATTPESSKIEKSSVDVVPKIGSFPSWIFIILLLSVFIMTRRRNKRVSC